MWRATRKTTKMSLPLIALLLLTLTFIGVSSAAETVETADTTHAAQKDAWSDPDYRTKVRAQHARAKYNQVKARAWHYKVEGAPRLPGLHRQLPMSKSLQTEVKRTQVWSAKREAAKQRFHAWERYWAKLDRSMWRAVKAAAREYGVSAAWLHACVSTEGGHGAWVMNTQGSGAGGWFQFMESTFYGYVHDARHKDRFPKKYAKWNSRVGQAFTAAYMFKIGQSRQWTGAGCN